MVEPFECKIAFPPAGAKSRLLVPGGHRLVVRRSHTEIKPGSPWVEVLAGEERVEMDVLSDHERQFMADQRIAHLATADRGAIPHAVPVCFVVRMDTLYVTIDEKPKRKPGTMLKRLQNIAENPAVAVVVDRYDEDWSNLGWVMLHGRAEILIRGAEHDDAQLMLRSRYPQLEAMQIAGHPVIAVRIQRANTWGNISVQEPRDKRTE